MNVRTFLIWCHGEREVFHDLYSVPSRRHWKRNMIGHVKITKTSPNSYFVFELYIIYTKICIIVYHYILLWYRLSLLCKITNTYCQILFPTVGLDLNIEKTDSNPSHFCSATEELMHVAFAIWTSCLSFIKEWQRNFLEVSCQYEVKNRLFDTKILMKYPLCLYHKISTCIRYVYMYIVQLYTQQK